MSTFSFPQDRQFQQANQGDFVGNVQMTYGVDLSQEPGKVKNSHTLLNLFDEADDADFSSKLNAICGSNSSTQRYFAINDTKVFYSAVDDPSTGWAESAGTSSPTLSVRSDMEFFGGDSGLFMVSGDSTGTIFSLAGATGDASNQWITNKGKSALNTNYYTPLRLGPQGAMFIVDAQKKVYRWANDVNGTITTSGNGTLDLTYSNLRIITLEASSTRMWFGCYSVVDGSGGVIEWDMSENSATFNRLHKLPSPVISIAIWNDSPYAVCMNGEIHAFNGSYFEKFAQFPVPDGFTGFAGSGSVKRYADPSAFTLMHPRGWAIIDGMPHFAINNQALNSTALTGSKQGYWKMPSGIWCLDQNVGLYCRYPFEIDAAAGTTAGSQSVKAVGALFALNTSKAKFLTGLDFYTDSAGTAKAALLKDDVSRTYATRSRISPTPFVTTKRQLWQKLEAMHKKLGNSSDRIIVKYRLNKSESLPAYADVTWTDSDTFTSTSSTFASAVAGDEVYVILGDGSGCSAHISSLSYSAPTYTVNLDDTVIGIAGSETGTVRVDNWRKLATISAQNVDYHEFSIPDTTASRKIELLIEMRSAASSTIELDSIQLTSKDA